MFGFLKRKREQPNLRAMHISLTNSFKNIKKDISHLHAKKQDHEGRLDQIERLLHHLHGKIEVILSYSDSESRSSTSPEVISPNEATSTFDFGALDSLTVVQRNILEMLIRLMNERGSSLVSLKDISEDLYPNKDYRAIRSLMSSYSDYLEEQGFIRKARKGRQTYLLLTERTKKSLKKSKGKTTLSVRKNGESSR
ncbi:hypothetical protein J4430_01335 [Candidatus Woesearchaeota archaeon]|nr:hypothetical protein [Candidatus Woesearchaeota archaeon]